MLAVCFALFLSLSLSLSFALYVCLTLKIDDAIFYLVTMCPGLRYLALPWEESKGITNRVSQECERIIKKMNPRLVVDRFVVQIIDENSL